MATVKQLIEQLNEIENKDQTVAFQYYLADDFEHLFRDNPELVRDDVFTEAVDVCDDYLWDRTWDDLAGEISDEIERLAPSDEEDAE